MSISGIARPNILNIKPYTPGKPIEALKRELSITGEIAKLASNENPLGPSPRAIAAVQKALPELHLYPDDTCFYLKAKIAERLEVPQEMVIITNGSAELIHLITTAFLPPDKALVRSTPSFIMGKIAAQIIGGKVINVPVKNNRHDIEAILSTTTSEVNIVYIDNPNNPLGTLIPVKEFEYLVEHLPKNTLLVIDEAYREYNDPTVLPPTLDYVKNKENIIMLRTFSKIYGLAGLRIGYGIASANIISILQRVRLPFNANRLAQTAASAAIDDIDYVQKSKALNDTEKDYLYRAFDEMKLPYIPSYTNFITVDIGRDTTQVYTALQTRGIIVRPLKAYNLPTHLRISIGTREQNERLISAMQEVLSQK